MSAYKDDKDYLIGLETTQMYKIGWEYYEMGLNKSKNPYVTEYLRSAWDWGWESAKVYHEVEPDIDGES